MNAGKRVKAQVSSLKIRVALRLPIQYNHKTYMQQRHKCVSLL
jgi:hypothetical protein